MISGEDIQNVQGLALGSADPGAAMSLVAAWEGLVSPPLWLDLLVLGVMTILCLAGWVTIWRLRIRRRLTQHKLNAIIKEQNAILQTLPDVPVVRLDDQMRIVWSNQAVCSGLQCDVAESIGQPCYRVLQNQDQPCPGCTAVQALRSGKVQAGQVTLPNGRTYDLRSTPLFDDQGKVMGLIHAGVEQTQLLKSQASEKEWEQRVKFSESTLNDGLWDWDVQTDRIFYSPKAKTLLGYPGHEKLDRPTDWFDRMDQSDQTQFQADLAFHLAGRTNQLVNEHRVQRANGEIAWLLCKGQAIRDEQGNVVRIAGTLSDITNHKRTEELLRLASLTDKLTGLPNRALFHERLNRAIKRAKTEPNYRYAVLMLDFDRFKLINDSLGHEIGDMLLIEIAGRLRASLRRRDIVAGPEINESVAARLGGDEFVVLLESIRQTVDATLVADRLQRQLSQPCLLDGHEVQITVSIGITTSDAGHQRAPDVLRDADTAMNQAKKAGKAQHVVFDHKMHEAVADQLRIEADLRKAIERQELVLFYQPIIILETGHLRGFEALIRWKHPQRGMIPPLDFIPIAEETGLIVPMGQWILQEACQQLSQWKKQFQGQANNLFINVNLSRRQLTQPDLHLFVDRVVRQTNIPHHDLQVEITESAVMQDGPAALKMLNQLKALGVGLVMDDFGTGYSSLSCLHRFPLNGLKIDRAFIAQMQKQPEYAAVVMAIITLAHNLGMQVTAEGIETPVQIAELQALECDHGQGYHFAKPMPAAEVEAFIQKYTSETRIRAAG